MNIREIMMARACYFVIHKARTGTVVTTIPGGCPRRRKLESEKQRGRELESAGQCHMIGQQQREVKSDGQCHMIGQQQS